MKKIIILVVFILLPLILTAQLSGSGTWASPYSGTFEGDLQWNTTNFPSGEVFIGGDVTIDDEELIIGAGMKVIFISNTADLIITSTGQLTADGTPSSQIRFTADDDDDGIFGETGERWGHISFQSMGAAGASLIDNCIIEYGDVSGNSGAASYGGCIYIDFNNLTISGCTIQHNKAKWGGGIFVNASRNPSIKTSYFYDNLSDEGGGGIYLWNYASSVVENCIFDSNHCNGTTYSYYTGGGLASQGNGSVKVLNCTFVNNTSSRTSGQSVQLYNSVANYLVNSIVWGSTGNHLYLSGTNTIQYCGVEGTAPSGTGNFLLNSSNTGLNPMGPFFKATDGSDWSIKVVSPCTDAGTTPSPTVPADYAGNSRVRTYDIGAYEVQYNYWLTSAGSTDWNTGSNWNGGVPTSSQNVVIPTGASNYPSVSTTIDFTIGSGYGMVLEPGAKVTLDQLTATGNLKLRSNSSNISSLIISNSGVTAIEELYLSGGGGSNYKWHYISTPVSSLSTDVFTGMTLNLVQFIESRPALSLTQGWVAFDGYEYYGGTSTGITFSSLTPGNGYNYYDATDNTFTFSGSLNTSDTPMSLAYSGEPSSMHGFNLLGNPFSSGLDWDDIADGVYYSYPSSTSKGVYFTRDNAQCTYINGVGTPSGVTGIIPPMQGFFTKTYSTGNTITIPAAARTQTNIHARYKGESVIPLVRLALFEDTISNDETVVRFDELAKTELDNDFDAIKMFLSSERTTIHTSLSGTDFAINGIPFPASNETTEIPVAVNLTSTGIHKLSASQLQGLDSYGITLSDNITGYTTDLKTNPEILFTAPSGSLTDRFILKISNIATGMEIPETDNSVFSIYHGYGSINIMPHTDEWNGFTGSIKVFDLSGNTVVNRQNNKFNRNSLIQLPEPAARGLYFVEIKSGIKKFVGKVIVK